MSFDAAIALAGLLVGFTVGMTGMGGGALMTPILVLLFKIDPLAAVSSDVVVSLLMKPIGGGVHLRRGTVNRHLVVWLCVGSVPAAFGGVVLLRALGGDDTSGLVRTLLGVVLLVAAAAVLARSVLQRRRADGDGPGGPTVAVRPLRTALIGAVGGLVVGLTSVGSGTLIIVMLLLAYPALHTRELVGTDLVQAIPLVASAALGHLLFGEVRLGLTASLVAGGIPGVYLGARVSSRAPDRIIRPALLAILVGSGLKLVGAF
jgi:uncharacterized membrane protein YfcA